jgi:hypothetical protein
MVGEMEKMGVRLTNSRKRATTRKRRKHEKTSQERERERERERSCDDCEITVAFLYVLQMRVMAEEEKRSAGKSFREGGERRENRRKREQHLWCDIELDKRSSGFFLSFFRVLCNRRVWSDLLLLLRLSRPFLYKNHESLPEAVAVCPVG